MKLPKGHGFVIAATDDREVNRGIAALCRERGIPVNAVDDKEQCTFLFPALVKRGDLTVGVSTAGASEPGAVGQQLLKLPKGHGPAAYDKALPALQVHKKRKIPRAPSCFPPW